MNELRQMIIQTFILILLSINEYRLLFVTIINVDLILVCRENKLSCLRKFKSLISAWYLDQTLRKDIISWLGVSNSANLLTLFITEDQSHLLIFSLRQVNFFSHLARICHLTELFEVLIKSYETFLPWDQKKIWWSLNREYLSDLLRYFQVT